MIGARPARLATTNVIDWKQEQKEDPVLYQVAKHLRVPHNTFRAAFLKVLDKKATATYIKAKEQILIKNGLLYRKTWQGQANKVVFQFVVPQRHKGCHSGWLPQRGSTPRPAPLHRPYAGMLLVARHDLRPQKPH